MLKTFAATPGVRLAVRSAVIAISAAGALAVTGLAFAGTVPGPAGPGTCGQATGSGGLLNQAMSHLNISGGQSCCDQFASSGSSSSDLALSVADKFTSSQKCPPVVPGIPGK